MLFVLRGRVWKEKPGQSASIQLQNISFRTEMFAALASAEDATNLAAAALRISISGTVI
jgi:hypothetical protein